MPATEWGTALVTGASSGIGRAFATMLARQGATVVAVARRQDRLDALKAALTAEGGRIEVLPADLGDADQLAAVEARLVDRRRPVDLLVNNAAFGTQGRFATRPIDEESRQVQLNVIALMRLTHAALGGMLERGHGGVVNVSSLVGHQPIPLWATYAATKAFVTSFSRALAEEVRGTGVRVLLLLPGFTSTEFYDQIAFTEHRIVPGPAWMRPESVAAAALRALQRGRTETVPGAHNRFVAAASKLSPWPLTARVLRVAMRRLW